MQPIAPPLLAWFEANKRDLPFRADPTPYHVWLSEIMLQQTRVAAVLPYYHRFLAALPTVQDLANCPEEQLHKLWEGLGYYSRVRNLQKAAVQICTQHGGALPADYDALLALSGIGEYTAGAIGSICFGLPVPAVDGNVLRVFARLYNDAAFITDPKVKKAFTARVVQQMPKDQSGAYNQALMELGALVCLPNGAPLCGQCPLAECCAARQTGTAQSLPNKAPKKARKITPVTVALIESSAGWLLQKRPEKGLLAGLWQPPIWEDALFASADELQAALAARGIGAAPDPQRLSNAPTAQALPAAKHIFTHIEWRMQGWQFTMPPIALPEGYVWADAQALQEGYTVPNAFATYKKIMLRAE